MIEADKDRRAKSGNHKRFSKNPLPTLADVGVDKNLAERTKGRQTAKGFSKNPLGPKALADHGIDKNLADLDPIHGAFTLPMTAWPPSFT
jgi:hypothetical protein